MRVEMCLCGGIIAAPSLDVSPPYVEAHGLSPIHQLWRAEQRGRRPSSLDRLREELEMEKIPAVFTRYRDPQCPTAGTTTRDLSGSKPSSSGAEVAG